MKIKCVEDDFQVEELVEVAPRGTGPYVLYRLEKRGIGTIEAVAQIRRQWNLGPQQVSYGGLKDRHASTVQYLTIARGPERGLETRQLRLEPIGRLSHPFGPGDITSNRFAIVLRDLGKETAARMHAAVPELARQGLPNYFDDQRFGSVVLGGEFLGEAWLRGDHERALWLALGVPHDHERPAERAQKAHLRGAWGDWTTAKRLLDRSNTRSIVTYLCDHPRDFKGAFVRLPRELRVLWFSAFQSGLWNALLGRGIAELAGVERCAWHAFKSGSHPFPLELDAGTQRELGRLSLPLPCARVPRPEGRVGEWAEEALAARGLTWEQLRVKGMDDVFFSKGHRVAVVVPRGVESSVERDPLYPGRQALRLAFVLPRGSYATVFVKALSQRGKDHGTPAGD